jgi:hypothetical protein
VDVGEAVGFVVVWSGRVKRARMVGREGMGGIGDGDAGSCFGVCCQCVRGACVMGIMRCGGGCIPK